MSAPDSRASDRWVTPGVIVAGLLVGGIVVSLLIVTVAWVTHEGLDPDPMLRLLGEIVTAICSVGALTLQLANRSSVTKTERNTGVLANGVYELADSLPRPGLPPVPASHRAPETAPYMGAAPAARGS